MIATRLAYCALFLGLELLHCTASAEPLSSRQELLVAVDEDRARAASASARATTLARVLVDARAPFTASARLSGSWQVLRPTRSLTPAELTAWQARLRADGRIKSVAPNAREQRRDVMPNDPRFAEQWWLQAVTPGSTGTAGFATAWNRSTGAPASGTGAVVAVLDSGITSHPELNPRLVPGYDFVSDALYAGDGDGRDNDPADPGDALTATDQAAAPAAFGGCALQPASSWHGTLIAGQLAAVTNEGQGVAATNWSGRFMPVRVAGKCGAAISDVIDGLRWAAGLTVDGAPPNPNPARVIVLGYGGADTCDLNSTDADVAATARLYTDVLAEVRAAGAWVVVAAGNLRAGVGRPAGCAGAYAVTALNREGYKANYASFGSAVAIATPGGDGNAGNVCDAQLADSGIVSTGNLGTTSPGAAGYAAGSGTSFAAPAVAGVATLMLAVNPALTTDQIEEGLRLSARPHVQVPLLGSCDVANPARCACTTTTCGAGMLDAAEALVYAAAPTAYAVPARTAPVLQDARIEACAALIGKPVDEPAPPSPPASQPDTGASTGGGGGGPMQPGWLAALAVAAWGLSRRRSDATAA